MSQEQEDRAREWTNENYPELDGPAWDAEYLRALADIVALDGEPAPTATLLMGVLTVAIAGDSHEFDELFTGPEHDEDVLADIAIDALAALGYGPKDESLYSLTMNAVRRALA